MYEKSKWLTLSDSQIEQIHEAALSYIERYGFVIQHKELLSKAKVRGATVDDARGQVRMSRTLCTELMSQVPSRYTVSNILGDSWEIGGSSQHGLAIVTDPWIVDYQTKEPRRPCLEDIRRHTMIADQLDVVMGVSRMDFPVTDFSGPTSSLHSLEAHLLHHSKHYLVMVPDLAGFDQWCDILRILSRDKDISRLATSAIAVGSPLLFNELNGELLIRSLANGFAILPTICPMAGSTAPYSLVGTLLQSHIEVLIVALLTQVVRPGSAVAYHAGLSVTDMRNGNDLYYTMDKVLWKTATVQLGKAVNMPVGAECGGTMTYRYDQQSGAEGMLFMLAAISSGANIVSGFGSCYNAIGMSAEMMVIHSAYLNAAKHLTKGIRTDSLQQAVESLERVGPGGQFLDDDLTMERLRSDEFFNNPAFDFSGGHGDSIPMIERAHEKVEQLVSNYQSRVPHDIQERLQRYFYDLY